MSFRLVEGKIENLKVFQRPQIIDITDEIIALQKLLQLQEPLQTNLNCLEVFKYIKAVHRQYRFYPKTLDYPLRLNTPGCQDQIILNAADFFQFRTASVPKITSVY